MGTFLTCCESSKRTQSLFPLHKLKENLCHDQNVKGVCSGEGCKFDHFNEIKPKGFCVNPTCEKCNYDLPQKIPPIEPPFLTEPSDHQNDTTVIDPPPPILKFTSNKKHCHDFHTLGQCRVRFEKLHWIKYQHTEPIRKQCIEKNCEQPNCKKKANFHTKGREPCHYWNAIGDCPKKEKCKYFHDTINGPLQFCPNAKCPFCKRTEGYRESDDEDNGVEIFVPKKGITNDVPGDENNHELDYIGENLTKKDLNIVIIGPTGAGKTSLINFFDVMHQRLQKESRNLEFSLKDLKRVKIQTKYLDGEKGSEVCPGKNISQTKECAKYEFIIATERQKIKLEISDTPGVGDVSPESKYNDYFGEDNRIVDSIITHFQGKVNKLNAIIIMINGSESRLNDMFIYMVERLKGFLPDNFYEICQILMSNVEVGKSSNLNINDLKLPIDNSRVFHLNNHLFTENIHRLSENKLDQLEQNYLKTEYILMKMLDNISKSNPLNVTAFQSLFQKRQQIFTNMQVLIEKAKSNIESREELDKMTITIDDGKTQIEELQKQLFKIETKQVLEFESTDYHNTFCSIHNCVCHEHCGLNETKEGSAQFKECLAFSGAEHCQNCQTIYQIKCGPMDHLHEKKKPITKTVKEQKIDQTVQNQMNSAKSETEKKEIARKNIQVLIQNSENEINDIQTKLQNFMMELKEICKNYNFLDDLDSRKKILLKQKSILNAKLLQAYLENDKAELNRKMKVIDLTIVLYDKIRSRFLTQ